MESKRMLECLDDDQRRLRTVAAAGGLTATVPTCPEWTLADLVRHVAAVYLHKVECMRTGSHPAQWPPPGIDDEEPIALLDRAYAALLHEFGSRAPQSPAFTWYGPDQTVGFWIRRMAQETVIHRVDAELAAGVQVAPIPVDLAEDGIDEFLVAFVEYGASTWPQEYGDVLATADGRAMRIATPDSAWVVRPTPEEVEVRVSDVDAVDASVQGAADHVLLWLWNRVGDDRVTVGGDPAVVAYLRKVFVTAGQ